MTDMEVRSELVPESRTESPLTSEVDACQVSSSNPVVVARIKADLAGVAPLAALFKLLGDQSRLTMVVALSRVEELCVCDLSEITGLAMPTVSHHLRRLREQGLVRSRREGKLVFYRLVDGFTRVILDLGWQLEWSRPEPAGP